MVMAGGTNVTQILALWAMLTAVALSDQETLPARYGRKNYAKRAPELNTTAPKYVIDESKSVWKTVLELTDYSCGKTRLCDPTNGSFYYAARCFKCESCRCDDLCNQYGDCCNDKSVRQQLSVKNLSEYVTCVRKFEDRGQPVHISAGISMVSKCPQKMNGHRQNETVDKRCQYPNLTDLTEATPVWAGETGMTYRNKFCAICHKVETFEPWTLSAKCKDNGRFSDAKSRWEIWSKVWTSSDCRIFAKSPAERDTRSCRLETVDTCSNGNKWAAGETMVRRLCAQLTNPVRFHQTWYSNIFCAMCNGVIVDRREVCQDPEVHTGKAPVPPLSVLLNFYPDEEKASHQNLQKTPGCSQSDIFNPLVDSCNAIVCPPRRVYNGSACVPIFHSSAGLGYSLSFILVVNKTVDLPSSGYLLRRYERELRKRLEVYRPYVLWPLQMTVTGQRLYKPIKRVRVYSLSVSLGFVSGAHKDMDELEGALRSIASEPWSFVKENVEIEFSPRTNRKDYSSDGILRNGFEILTSITKKDSSEVFGSSCARKDCLGSVRFMKISDGLKCPFVKFNAPQFGGNFSLSDSSIIFRNRSFNLPRHLYRQIGGEIDMCVSEITTIVENLHSSEDIPMTEPLWKSVLSTVCLTLSIICLFLTFLIYWLLPSLRTLPGKNTMGLVFHLFFTQLLYVCGVNATSNSILCSGIGVVIHFLWLASFFWMFICAYHMYTIFSNLLSNTKSATRERNERRNFIHYSLFADLSPLVLVTTCIAYFLGSTGGTEIGYGGHICFLKSKEAIGIFFAAPLLLVLIFNFFFFIRTVLSIRRTPDVVAHNSANRNYVGIYFRLSILLGFGWIFGFPIFSENVILFCIFCLLTGGQGVFIFFSFCANKRVLSLLSTKFPWFKWNFVSNVSGSSKSTET